MIFTETKLKGSYIIEPERIGDDRGFFARLFCNNEFEEHGLKTNIKQTNVGFSTMKGTQRGLHFQKPPHQEVKIVRCSRGAIFNVIVDLRSKSKTYKQWYGIELNEDNRLALYVPEGFAQGYRTLVDNSEMYYHTTAYYAPDHACGVRFNDPAFDIHWPGEALVVSDADKSWPYYIHSFF